MTILVCTIYTNLNTKIKKLILIDLIDTVKFDYILEYQYQQYCFIKFMFTPQETLVLISFYYICQITYEIPKRTYKNHKSSHAAVFCTTPSSSK